MPYIIKDECVVCWKCIEKCVVGAIVDCEIQITEKFHVQGVRIDYDVCTECGLCTDVCPVDAIVKSEENTR